MSLRQCLFVCVVCVLQGVFWCSAAALFVPVMFHLHQQPQTATAGEAPLSVEMLS